MHKKLSLNPQVKLLEDGNGSLEGYGSTFGGSDRVGDVIVKGAFQKSLDRFRQDGFLAIGHDWNGLPVGSIAEAYEDEKGLYIRSDFHSTETAQAARTTVRERLDRGKSVGLSIGFNLKDSERTAQGRILKEIELFEVSVVTVPCNPAAEATGAKALYLGQYAEQSMTLAALRDCYDSLFYNALYTILFDWDEERSPEEKISQAEAAINEAGELCLRALRGMLSYAVDDDAKSELEAEYKDVFSPPARVAGRLSTQLVAVLDAAADITERHEKITLLRAEQGRLLSAERCEQLTALTSRLGKILSARVTEETSLPDTSLLQLQAELAATRLSLARVSAR